MSEKKNNTFRPTFETLEKREMLAADLTSALQVGFESGLDSWEVLGDVSTVDGSFGEAPSSGNAQAILTTRDTAGGRHSDTDIAAFLGLQGSTLDATHGTNVTAGSALRHETTVEAGAVLTFDYNFLTQEFTSIYNSFNDLAFFTIVGEGIEETHILADTHSDGFSPSGAFPYQESTGYRQFEHTFETGGTYTIGFGVSDVLDSVVDSALLLDSIQLTTPIAPNRAPIAEDATLAGVEDVPLSVNVFQHSSDPDGDVLTAVILSGPEHGTLIANEDGTFTYTPNQDFHGTDQFIYTVSDGELISEPAFVNLTVSPVNDAPTVSGAVHVIDEDTSLELAESTSLLASATDPEGDPLTAVILSGPEHGTLTANEDGTFTYTPNQDFHGIDQFIYTASDGELESDPTTLSITVNPINDRPTVSDSKHEIDEDTSFVFRGSTDLLDSAFDVDGDILKPTIKTGPEYGTLTAHEHGTFTYTPEKDFHGTDQFSYIVTDGELSSALATVSINVYPTNDAPLVEDDTVTIPEDVEAWKISALANDHDPDGDMLSIVSASTTNGKVTISEDGQSIEHTPSPDFNGSVTITYVADDGNGETALGRVTVTVKPVNDAPIANESTTIVQEDSGATPIDVLANDTDIDGDRLTVQKARALHGTVQIVDGGAGITYTPDANFNGKDHISYTIDDGNGGLAVSEVSLIVQPKNDAPFVNDEAITIREGDQGVIPVLSNDTDVDGDTLTFTITRGPSHGKATVNEHGAVTYTPSTDFFGTDSITYQVSDGNGGSRIGKAQITVTPINDAPITTTTSTRVNIVGEAAKAINLNDLFKDVDHEKLQYKVRSSTNRRLLRTSISSESGMITVTSLRGRQGVTGITVVATDSEDKSAETLIVVVVKPEVNSITFEQSNDDGSFWITDDGQLYHNLDQIAVSVKQAIMLKNQLFTLSYDGKVNLYTENLTDPWKPLTADQEQIFHQLATYEGRLLALGWERSGKSTGDIFRWVDQPPFMVGDYVATPAQQQWELIDPDVGHNAVALVNHQGKTIALRSNGGMYELTSIEPYFERLSRAMDDLYNRISARTQQSDPFPSVKFELSLLRGLRNVATGSSVIAQIDNVIQRMQFLDTSGHQLDPWDAKEEMSKAQNQLALAELDATSSGLWRSIWPAWKGIPRLSFQSYSALVSAHGELFAYRSSQNELARYDSNLGIPFVGTVQLPGSGDIRALVKHGNDAIVLRGNGIAYRYNGSNWAIMSRSDSRDADLRIAKLTHISGGAVSKHRDVGQVSAESDLCQRHGVVG